jgi:hypothetical protein
MSTPQVSPTTGMGQNTGAAGNQDFLDKVSVMRRRPSLSLSLSRLILRQ